MPLLPITQFNVTLAAVFETETCFSTVLFLSPFLGAKNPEELTTGRVTARQVMKLSPKTLSGENSM